MDSNANLYTINRSSIHGCISPHGARSVYAIYPEDFYVYDLNIYRILGLGLHIQKEIYYCFGVLVERSMLFIIIENHH